MVLEGTVDLYNGIFISSKSLPEDELQFGRELDASLAKWKSEGRKGIWLNIPADKSSFIPIAIAVLFTSTSRRFSRTFDVAPSLASFLALGFEMHQCTPKAITMTRWLPDSPNKLPRAPFTFIGVSGFVLNDKGEVLAVKEKSGPGARLLWKTPGGMMDPGEYVHETAVREVFEETGIKAEFVSILSFRHMPDARMGNGDMYVTCLLKALSTDIKIQEDEIADAKWMTLDEFLAQSTYRGIYKKILLLGAEAAKGKYSGWKAEKLPIAFKPGENYVYHGGPLGAMGAKL